MKLFAIILICCLVLLTACSIENSAYSHLQEQQLISGNEGNVSVYDSLQQMEYTIPTHPCQPYASTIESYKSELRKAILTSNASVCNTISERDTVYLDCDNDTRITLFDKKECVRMAGGFSD